MRNTNKLLRIWLYLVNRSFEKLMLVRDKLLN